MSSNREKLLAQFRELVIERLAKVTKALMTLESGPDAEAGKLALRELHGLKGEARMMGFAEVNQVVHQMEEILRATSGLDYAILPASTDALLAAGDGVSVLTGAVAGDAPDVAALLSWLEQCAAGERSRARTSLIQAAPPTGPSAPAPTASAPPAAAPAPMAPVPAPLTVPAPPGAAAKQDRGGERGAKEASIRITQASLELLTSTVTGLQQRQRRAERVGEQRRALFRELSALHRAAEDVPALAEYLPRLQRLKDLAGEVNRTHAVINTEQARDLAVLREEIQALRMLPLGLLFEPYPRMVREVAKELGRDVELAIDGEDERVDRSVLEALRDPLMHLVRNSLDHGLESADERIGVNKPARGTLQIRAFRDGERLVLRVQDDGRGLDPARLRQIGVERRLVTAEAAQALTDQAAMELVFLSGFSSKTTATELSGRGVGLDVVRSNILAVGGEVTVASQVGKGASFELRVPVSLTVAPVLFIQQGEARLALGASSVLRAVTPEPGELVELAGRPHVRTEGALVPFTTLARALGEAPERPPRPGELVLIIRGEGQQAAVAVDRVLEERVQAVLPLRGVLAGFTHLSGATPLADGHLAMMLSAGHLVRTAHGRSHALRATVATTGGERVKRLLVVDDSPLTRELLVALLEAVGYEIREAGDGVEALDALDRHDVDAVVTDLEMPRMDGLELTRRIKSHPALRALPVIIVTTRGSDADRQRGMAAGADGYVTKGDLVRQDLVDVVARLLP